MKRITIIRSKNTIELYEYVEDFYLISKKANEMLERLRKGLPTWFPEKYDEMNISIWIYYDVKVNAFCYYEKEKNYIKEKGINKIQEHAYDFVEKRLAPANLPNHTLNQKEKDYIVQVIMSWIEKEMKN